MCSMFCNLLYIHLFRPFLKYSPSTSPLPVHVSPRKLCTAAASAISKLMRLYKRTYGLRQICNIAVYIVHSACTIHLLNQPSPAQLAAENSEGKASSGETIGKAARRDIVHGVKHLEEIAEDWLCARRTLSIISVLARKWKIILPGEAQIVLERTDRKYGTFSTKDVPSPASVDKGVATNISNRSSPVASDFNTQVHNHMSTPPHQTQPADMTQFVNNKLNQSPTNMMGYSAQPRQSWQPLPRDQSYNTFSNNINNLSYVSPSEGQLDTIYQVQPASSYTQPPQMQNNFHQSHQQQRRPTYSTAPSSSSVASIPGMTVPAMPNRQISPGTMFNHAEALAESNSQEWWLRDQAALAEGFENWGTGSPELDVMDGTTGTGGVNAMGMGFNMPMVFGGGNTSGNQSGTGSPVSRGSGGAAGGGKTGWY